MENTQKISQYWSTVIAAVISVVVIISAIFNFNAISENDRLITKESFREYKMEKRGGDTSKKPTEWFTLQRAYPYDNIPYNEYKLAMERAEAIRNATTSDIQFTATLAGPSNVGGRITGLAVHPDDNDIIYAGAALGGIFKSVDGGDNWSPISDDVPSLSVGDIAMDPSNPDRIYFGTGEANSSGDSYAGTGIYRTTTGGLNWE
ncbi:MAG: hypothetical protein GY855_09585, partial [candidate division Zixibacteria bacterium]|nr:hypothetical protein [candidate division Zixibacteria bacterium]